MTCAVTVGEVPVSIMRVLRGSFASLTRWLAPPFVIALFAIVVLPKYRAYADVRNVYGISFEVDRVAEVDDAAVEVQLFGDRVIIPRSHLDRYIVEAYAEHRPALFQLSQMKLRSFVKDAVRDGAADIAYRGFEALLTAKGMSERKLLDFIDSLEQYQETLALYKRALEELPSAFSTPAVVSRILLYVGVRDPEWSRVHAKKSAELYRKELQVLLERRFQEAVRSQELNNLNGILLFEQKVFGVDDPHYQRLSATAERMEELISGLKQPGNLSYLKEITESIDRKKGAYTHLTPLVLDALHGEVKTAIEQGDPGLALQILSWLDFERRTPTTHELVRNALRRLPPSPESVLQDEKVRSRIEAYSQYDDTILSLYTRALEGQVYSYLDKGNGEVVERFFRHLQRIRPDPNEANDEIRIAYSRFLRQQGNVEKARALEKQVATGLPLGARMRALLFDHGAVSLFLFLFVWGAVLLFGWHLYTRWKQQLSVGGRRELGSAEGEEPVRPMPSQLHRRSAAPKLLNPMQREYLDLLKKFNLTASASLSDIKNAYRHEVKEHHPDVRRESTTASDEFITLTQAYERILELRSRMGLFAEDE